MTEPIFMKKKIYREGEQLGRLLLRPFELFAQKEASSGILILLASAAALIWVNSSFSESYEHLWHVRTSIGAAGFVLDRPIHFWINDGLMALFFFLVGLEIKREILVGELGSFRKAFLPVSAAIGGMLVPALIYFALNPSGPGLRGWGIPMATDIAFVIGAMTVLGSRIPHGLVVFITALAIADDLGAVLVIALFYTANISTYYLSVAGVLFLVLIAMNILGFRKALPYAIVGIPLWLFVHLSGIHSTVAGVLIAMTIPARSKYDTDDFVHRASEVLDEFKCAGSCGYSVYTNSEHQSAVRSLATLCRRVEPLLIRLEFQLHPWVVFLVVPIFALANAGVSLQLNTLLPALHDPVVLGTIAGLVLGKTLGISLASWLAIKTGIAELPEQLELRHIYAGSILCGIGFTMSLFIANLAFEGTQELIAAKIGIFVGSLISFLVGFTMLYMVSREKRETYKN
jgi:NhaA family Na+:H+ antiporter